MEMWSDKVKLKDEHVRGNLRVHPKKKKESKQMLFEMFGHVLMYIQDQKKKKVMYEDLKCNKYKI